MGKPFRPLEQKKKITGLRVLGTGTTENALGKRIAWYDLRCKCGAKFRVFRHVATRAECGAATLQCDACRYQQRLEKQNERYHALPPEARTKPTKKPAKKRSTPPGVTHELIGDRPPITPEAVRILAKHAHKPYYQRARAILAEHIDACVEARIVPDWNRGAVEAIEKAQEEYRTGKPVDADRWTPQNRADGLQIVSYPVYQMPSPL